MTPELEKQIVSLIEAAKQAGSGATSFIATQAPEAIQQMLAWETAKASALTALALFGVLLLAWCGRKLAKLNDADEYPPPAIAYALSIFCAVLMGCAAMRIVKIQIAPKVVVLECVGKLAARQ